MNAQEILDTLGLMRLPGAGGGTVSRLLLHAGSAAAVWQMSDDTLAAHGVREPTLAAMRHPRAASDPDTRHMRDRLLATGVTVLGICEPAYPARLREIASPPPLLFVRGSVEALASPQLAMVGTRKPSPGGRRVARGLAAALARYGLTITSGLALGIDTESHRGAIADGLSVAVMGTGPDRIYPASNRELAEAILAGGGAAVSEFLPGTGPEPHNFPRRNRIISGLSLGVLVVEAALPSGSLVTAQCAAEQNRDVMAVPGPVQSPVSRGCHMLLKNGAALIETAEDVLLALGDRFRPVAAPPLASWLPGMTVAPAGLNPEQSRVLAGIGLDETSHDQLVLETGHSPAVVSAALAMLELQGLVVRTPRGFTRSR